MYGCGELEAGVASGSGWNLWVWLLGVVVRRYIDFLILLIPTPLIFVLFAAAFLLFVHFVKCFSFFIITMQLDFFTFPHIFPVTRYWGSKVSWCVLGLVFFATCFTFGGGATEYIEEVKSKDGRRVEQFSGKISE